MMKRISFGNFKVVGIFCLAFGLAVTGISAADGPPTNAAPSGHPEETPASNEALRAYLQLQETIHATQLSIERSLQEAQASDIRNADALSNRLQLIEESLAMQRKAELEAIQGANHLTLFVLGTFVVIGLMAVLLTAFFQWRAIYRLSEIAGVMPSRRAVGPAPAAAALALSENQLVTAGQVEQTNARLFGIIERLEKRIIELEHSAQPALKGPSGPEHADQHADQDTGHDHSGNGDIAPAPQLASNFAAADRDTRITFLLDKGQMLLDTEQSEEAVACFDEVLAMHAAHAEALVKKGVALEKLRRPSEAIDCYDRAIAADRTLTIAYLYKGGLCNRLERFSEAVECYEQALRTQEKQHAA